MSNKCKIKKILRDLKPSQNLRFKARQGKILLFPPRLQLMDAKYLIDSGIKYSYGTAGFRLNSQYMLPVAYRMGILSTLRSMSKAGAAIGVMITASHNPEKDNGVKIIDSDGEMLSLEWEAIATNMANAGTEEDIQKMIDKIKNRVEENLSKHPYTVIKPHIMVGRDTRSSSMSLAQSVIEGVLKFESTHIQDYGLVTTPQLHFLVASYNRAPTNEISIQLYYQTLSEAFIQLVGWTKDKSPHLFNGLVVDAANGVGAVAMSELIKWIDEWKITMIHHGEGILNHNCGADYVKVNQCPPKGLVLSKNTRYASLDGDADRIVYYCSDENGKFYLLDGDKIASLIAKFLQESIHILGIDKEISIGVVQTAYANGYSTKYLKEQLKLNVEFVQTGVKNLHAKAKDFDIGIYFEANGHGTVLFSHHYQQILYRLHHSIILNEEQKRTLSHLIALVSLVNPATGDAISDLLMIESILHLTRMGMMDWVHLYTELPNRLMKLCIQDRNTFKTTNADQTLLSPPGIQEKIDRIVSRYPFGRSFVRPSGTEDVVRIYAEANTSENSNRLAIEVSELIYNECGGMGEKPTL